MFTSESSELLMLLGLVPFSFFAWAFSTGIRTLLILLHKFYRARGYPLTPMVMVLSTPRPYLSPFPSSHTSLLLPTTNLG
ncbi:hypothetical protein BDZ91DRAFT_723970 [Kalaharituber pfeilii]|nr:hypothetical protein BDZ91DRAFT_723970 [Kalaharituber pfeilii]